MVIILNDSKKFRAVNTSAEQAMGQQRCLASLVVLATLSFIGGSVATLIDDPIPRINDIKLPYGFKVCGIHDPSFERCLLNAAEQNRLVLNEGYPDFKIPPLNPLYVNRIVLDLNPEPSFSVIVEQRNLQVDYEFSTFLDVRLDDKQRVLSVVALLREVQIHGEHFTVGRSRNGPIRGHGPIHTTLEQLTVTFELQYSLYQRNGREYMHLDKLRVRLDPEYMRVVFEGVLHNPYQNDLLLKTLNRDWPKYYGPALPAVETQLGAILKRYIEGLFYYMPFKTLFPE